MLGELKHLDSSQPLPLHLGTQRPSDAKLVEGLLLRQGAYFDLRARMETLKLTLSTALLNHLMFVAKVFQNEVNDVFAKMSKSGKEDSANHHHHAKDALHHQTTHQPFATNESHQTVASEGPSFAKVVSRSIKADRGSSAFLYSLHVEHEGIVITATAHATSALRFETDKLEVYVSNRIISGKNAANAKRSSTSTASSPKVFVKASVDLEIGLGNLVKNHVYEEQDNYEEADLNQLAFFKTRIGVRNALPSEMIDVAAMGAAAQGDHSDKEAVLISLARPVVMVQSVAFDKAVVIWMNYKNAYDYWQRQRAGFDGEIIDVVRGVGSTFAFSPNSEDSFERESPSFGVSNSGVSGGGNMFPQLTVDDLGICLPLVNDQQQQRSSSTHLPRDKSNNPASSFSATLDADPGSSVGGGAGMAGGQDDGTIPAGGMSSTSSVSR